MQYQVLLVGLAAVRREPSLSVRPRKPGRRPAEAVTELRRELDKEQCYRLLGLPREASQGDLETAYGQEKRRLYALRAQQGGRLSAEQRQTLVQLHFAHRLLADPLSRRVYDRLGVYGVVLARRGRLARRALDLLSPHQCRVGQSASSELRFCSCLFPSPWFYRILTNICIVIFGISVPVTCSFCSWPPPA